MLSLRWYDAQGCIESEPFNILENFHVFITMIIIFQRHTTYLWGISQQNSSEIECNGQTFRIDETPSRFQLHGRRTASFDAELSDSQETNIEACTHGTDTRISRSKRSARDSGEETHAPDGHIGKLMLIY